VDWSNLLGDASRALIGSETVVFALAAIGLNVQFGYTGLLNFGQAAFLAVAAYGLAATVVTFGLPFWIGILVGFAGVVVLAVLLGVPTLRLRADYLAIVTIAASEIIRLIFRSVTLRDTFGGSGGISGFSNDFYELNPYDDRVGVGPFEFGPRDAWVLTVGWVLVILACLIVWALMRSPWGRVIKAIREDEDAVRSLGKNVYSYKMQALVFGGCLAALGGMVLTVSSQSITPDAFSSELSFFAFAALLLGGRGTLGGPILGAMLFWFLASGADSLLRQAVSAGGLDGVFAGGLNSGAVRFILVGLALVLFMLFRANGILGAKQRRAVGSEQV
jgi:neutral amino acid transport system permease protein